MKKLSLLFSLLVVASMILTACGGGGPSSTKGEVTFWHAYGTGSAEETALATILGSVPVTSERSFP
jgi:ABC-type glycerol-3-phosphate transport system substrate-binding protein